MTLTWQAGDNLDVNNLNSRVPIWVIKGVTESLPNSAVMQADNELTLSLAANTTYHIKALIIANATINSDGIKVDWTIPSGAILKGLRRCIGPESGSASRVNTNMTVQVSSDTLDISYGVQEAVDVWAAIEEEFLIEIVTAGSITINWAQITSHADATKVRAGSYIRAERVL